MSLLLKYQVSFGRVRTAFVMSKNTLLGFVSVVEDISGAAGGSALVAGAGTVEVERNINPSEESKFMLLILTSAWTLSPFKKTASVKNDIKNIFFIRFKLNAFDYFY